VTVLIQLSSNNLCTDRPAVNAVEFIEPEPYPIENLFSYRTAARWKVCKESSLNFTITFRDLTSIVRGVEKKML